MQHGQRQGVQVPRFYCTAWSVSLHSPCDCLSLNRCAANTTASSRAVEHLPCTKVTMTTSRRLADALQFAKGSLSPYHNDTYQVGWICALPIELAAAEGMLDDKHGTPQVTPPKTDGNTYVLGRIHKHNVVIACLPRGEIGAPLFRPRTCLLASRTSA